MAAFQERNNNLLKQLTDDCKSNDDFQKLHEKIDAFQKEFKKREALKALKPLGINDKWKVYPFRLDINNPEYDDIQELNFNIYIRLIARGRYLDSVGFSYIIDPEDDEDFNPDSDEDELYPEIFPKLNFVGGEKAFAPTEKEINEENNLKWEPNGDYKDPASFCSMKSGAFAYHRKVEIDLSMLYLAYDIRFDTTQWFKIEKVLKDKDHYQGFEYYACRMKKDGSFKSPCECDTNNLSFDEWKGKHIFPESFHVFETKPIIEEDLEPEAKIARKE